MEKKSSSSLLPNSTRSSLMEHLMARRSSPPSPSPTPFNSPIRSNSFSEQVMTASSSSSSSSSRSSLMENLQVVRSSTNLPSPSPTPFNSPTRPNSFSELNYGHITDGRVEVEMKIIDRLCSGSKDDTGTSIKFEMGSSSSKQCKRGQSVRTHRSRSLCESRTNSLSASRELVDRKEIVTYNEREVNQGDHHSISETAHILHPKPIVIVVNDNVYQMIMASDKLQSKGLGVVMTTDVEIAIQLIGGIPSQKTCRHTCPKCQNSYSDADTFKEHKCTSRFSVKRKFPCPAMGCGVVLTTAQTLGKHIRTHEVDERSCIECGKTFETVQMKNSHLGSHKKAYKKKQVENAYDELRVAFEELKVSNKALQDEVDRLKINQKIKPVVLFGSSKSEASSFLKMVKEQCLTNVPVVVMSEKSESSAKMKYMEGAAAMVSDPLQDEDVASILKLFGV